MHRFTFRLQRVLQWQIRMCHVEEESMRLCRLAVIECEQRIAQLSADRSVVEQELLNQHSISASDLSALANYRVQVVRRGHELEARRHSLEADLEKQMVKLMTARRQVKRIELLRDRAMIQHNFAMNRELEALALETHLSKLVTSTFRTDAIAVSR